MLHPYKFRPIFKTVLWGGDKLSQFKGVDTQLSKVGESWEISGIPGRESIVCGGEDDGLTLRELIARHGAALVGDAVLRRHGTEFPLLVKFIDAHDDLSIQVHPDDKLARRRHGTGGKTEMWYIIDSEPHSHIGVGLNRAITPRELDRMVADGSIADAIAQHESHADDVFYLPGGRIHTIGAGNLLAEIQQACDITYRVYDFDRRDARGNPRELHTHLAKNAIDYTVHDSYVAHYDRDGQGETTLVQCEHFVVTRAIVDGQLTLAMPQSFMIVMCIDGNVTLTDDAGGTTTMRRGETILVPACRRQLIADGQATLLTTYLPE